MGSSWFDSLSMVTPYGAVNSIKDFVVEKAPDVWDAARGFVKIANTRDFNDLPGDTTLFQSKYDFTQRRFPIDLGDQSYNGHYMVININTQNGTRFKDSVESPFGRVNTAQRLDDELSKTDALRYNIDDKWKDSDGISFSTTNSGLATLSIPRQTRRTVESIALYMPNTVVFDTSNDYEDVGLTNIGGSMLQTASSWAGSLAGGSKLGKSIKSGLGAAGDVASGVGKVSQLLQRPINPRIEVLFRNTLQRTFQFDFLFAPSSKEETIAMKQIIKTLRFHAAPEYENAIGAFMYIPPSEFDITFYNRGIENEQIPRISTCALTKISVDYAPQGVYSTFRESGAPVSCRMQIEFRELEVVSKLRVLQGF